MSGHLETKPGGSGPLSKKFEPDPLGYAHVSWHRHISELMTGLYHSDLMTLIHLLSDFISALTHLNEDNFTHVWSVSFAQQQQSSFTVCLMTEKMKREMC